MRLLLDTTVLVSAVRSRNGASRNLLIRGLRRAVTLLVSVPVMLEYEAVLMRAEHRKASGMSAEDVGLLLDTIAQVAVPVEPHFVWRPSLPDPDDEAVFDAAVNGRADALVTFNRRHFEEASRRFGLAICSPGEVLVRLASGGR